MPFFMDPVSPTQENLDQALAMIDSVSATGGTNIADALKWGLRGGSKRTNLVRIMVFLTDGQPTVSTKDPEKLLAVAKEWNGKRSRVFVFGVGNDVNTNLLDRLAESGGGTRDYVREHEDIEEKTGALFTKLSHPVMQDIELEIDGVRVSRVVPRKLPDLFAGSRLEIFGRYLGEGTHAIRLRGMVGDERREYVYEGSFTREARADHDFVPALWAQRRVGLLLDNIRLNGQEPELIDEICRLGLEYRIVTKYTSHLIVEEGLRVTGGPATRRERGPGGPTTPGSSGPTTVGGGSHGGQYRGPGDSAPTGGTGGGPASPAGPGAMGPVTAGGGPGGPDLDEIAGRLRDAGVLPKDASREELRDLAGEIAREMREADRALRGLGYTDSGEKAVSDSVYLARLVGRDHRSGSDGFYLGRGESEESRKAVLINLFTQKLKDKVLLLREGVWTDRELTEELAKKERTVVEAYSDEYFALLREKPALASYFAFSSRLVIVYDGVVYEVVPPKDEETQEGEGGETAGG